MLEVNIECFRSPYWHFSFFSSLFCLFLSPLPSSPPTSSCPFLSPKLPTPRPSPPLPTRLGGSQSRWSLFTLREALLVHHPAARPTRSCGGAAAVPVLATRGPLPPWPKGRGKECLFTFLTFLVEMSLMGSSKRKFSNKPGENKAN